MGFNYVLEIRKLRAFPEKERNNLLLKAKRKSEKEQKLKKEQETKEEQQSIEAAYYTWGHTISSEITGGIIEKHYSNKKEYKI